MAEATAVRKPRVSKPKAESKVAPKESPKASKGSFAVIMTGGKQYLVHPGQKLKIEKILGDHKVGDAYIFKNVLLAGDTNKLDIGTPMIKGSVSATITNISRYKTVDVIKYKQKSRYFKKYGHRQPYFEVRIDSIN